MIVLTIHYSLSTILETSAFLQFVYPLNFTFKVSASGAICTFILLFLKMNSIQNRNPKMNLNNSKIPNLLVSDLKGNIFEIPELLMTGTSLDSVMLPSPRDLIPLPSGSDLFRLPGRVPIGYDPSSAAFVSLSEYRGVKVEAVGAFMAPAYLQILRSSFEEEKNAPRLPLYCYTAAGWYDNEFMVAGMRIDSDKRQDFENFDLCLIEKNAKAMAARHPHNRLVQHLVDDCVLRYGCPAARNFVMGRWECPVPTSRACNASCLGCISKQPVSSGFVASHDRITFTPTVEEIVDFVVPHLQTAPRPVASFGQGCEGEPLLEGELIADAVGEIRKKTSRGIINVNTNASLPREVEKLCVSGLDSIRVSMSSARRLYYDRYYRPKNYSFDDVVESLRIMRKYRRWSSINYLIFPGFTDTPEEMEALGKLISEVKINMIQTRNLNLDPVFYIKHMKVSSDGDAVGIKEWVKYVKREFPDVRLGYFNPPLSVMKKTL